MRRPVDPPINITGDRASHAAYGVGPATDYAVPIGTPIVAPFSGHLTKYVTTAGGLGVMLTGTDAIFYGQHLWVRLEDGQYTEGARIALSGNTGTLTTGPHLHCYIIIHATGERLSMEEYLTRLAGGDSRPIPTPSPEEDDMPPLRIAYFRGVPGTTADTICVVNVAEHTFYRVASTVQKDFIKQTAGDKLQDIAGVQAFDLIRGFREI